MKLVDREEFKVSFLIKVGNLYVKSMRGGTIRTLELTDSKDLASDFDNRHFKTDEECCKWEDTFVVRQADKLKEAGFNVSIVKVETKTVQTSEVVE
ncbi:hypothetical protein Q7A53_05915 [Halobacillus rhizosphaerae]|uniref:hypothetical protein n=1 Tax=Halobacillus rhizosphaerae TaxID=3064889 RepID=UPI00398B8B2E